MSRKPNGSAAVANDMHVNTKRSLWPRIANRSPLWLTEPVDKATVQAG